MKNTLFILIFMVAFTSVAFANNSNWICEIPCTVTHHSFFHSGYAVNVETSTSTINTRGFGATRANAYTRASYECVLQTYNSDSSGTHDFVSYEVAPSANPIENCGRNR